MSKPLTDFQRRVVLDKYEPDSDVVGMALVAALDRLDFLERKLQAADVLALEVRVYVDADGAMSDTGMSILVSAYEKVEP
jgi:hypothetical protein